MRVGPLGWAVLLGQPGIALRHLERDRSLRPEDRNIAYFAALHELWHRDQPPSPDQERELMARFGMERA